MIDYMFGQFVLTKSLFTALHQALSAQLPIFPYRSAMLTGCALHSFGEARPEGPEEVTILESL